MTLKYFLGALLATSALNAVGQAAVELKEEPGRIRVEIDGQLFTNYCFQGAPHVYFYPIIGPGGAKMTRSWPMEEVAGEEHDHPHHRSLWFAHGDVNGTDFWTEEGSKKGKHPATGRIVHQKFLELKSGENEALIRDLLAWTAPDGTIPLTSEQTLRVYRTAANERLFDYEMTLVAGANEVVFGDTKEGTLGMRIAESMRLMLPGKQPGQGAILNSTGDSGEAAWGKRARWVDMSGPVAGKTVGVAIFDHPANLRHPTRWHARDYGLFAANPFCEQEMDRFQLKGSGIFKLPAGQKITFKYRFYLHEGNATQAGVPQRYLRYIQTTP